MRQPNNAWSVIYETAVREDGSLLFPERLTQEFLEEARRGMGSILFANQYLNEIFPADDAKFKREWFKTWSALPQTQLYTFAFIDPAISLADGADYTGTVVVSVDYLTNWYVRHASRKRLNPTQIIDWMFQIHREFNCTVIGVEDVAFQKSILHFADDEMKRRQIILPLKGANKGNRTDKETYIQSLIPYYEFGRVFHTSDCDDLERELLQFPRSSHDDVSEALALIQKVVFYPTKPREDLNNVSNPHDTRYESKVIRDLVRKANEG